MSTKEISLVNKDVKPVIDHLNELIANYHIHYQKLRGCHWNVKGPRFFTLHTKFEELYTHAQASIDALAERILTLGESPYSTFSEYIMLSELKEINTVELSDREMVFAILEDFSKLIELERYLMIISSEAEDYGTNDLINTLLQYQEKNSWMLRSFTA